MPPKPIVPAEDRARAIAALMANGGQLIVDGYLFVLHRGKILRSKAPIAIVDASKNT